MLARHVSQFALILHINYHVYIHCEVLVWWRWIFHLWPRVVYFRHIHRLQQLRSTVCHWKHCYLLREEKVWMFSDSMYSVTAFTLWQPAEVFISRRLWAMTGKFVKMKSRLTPTKYCVILPFATELSVEVVHDTPALFVRWCRHSLYAPTFHHHCFD